MEHILELVRSLHSAEGLKQLVQSGGLFALTAIVFAETGLLVGFFLPGDSLLITAGIFAATDGHGGPGLLSLPALLIVLSITAVIGDQVGYFLGKKTGKAIYARPDSFLFKKKNLKAAHEFFEKHGTRAIILARFVPIVRTFVPFSAGVAEMDYKTFLRFDIFGGILWICSMITIGYKLGLSRYADQLHKIILVVIFVSIIPLMVGVAKKFLNREQNQPQVLLP